MRHNLFLALIAMAAAAAAGAAVELAAVESLRAGQRGVGRTVFSGTDVDTFGVEILGVVRNGLGPRQDLILARLSGGPLAETGVIQGMSGSPVYVDGRLVGAVSYAWPFARTPLCGITPIAEMLRVAARGLERPAEERRPQGSLQLGSEVAEMVRRALGDAPSSGPLELEPLSTPVWTSGATPEATRALQEVLRPLGLRPVAGPGGQADGAETPALMPGASLGVQLIAGDLSATGIGTLTYIDGERVVGFGHPMMLAGATDMPMTGAYIHGIMPSQYLSFKVGSATRAVGAIRQDRAAAVAGVVGSVPDLVPVEVRVSADSSEHRYRFGVLRHPELTAGLTQVVLLSALESTEKLMGAATVRLHAQVDLAEGRRLEKEQVYSGAASIVEAAEQAVAPLAAIDESPFAGLRLEAVRFEAELRERIESAQVTGLRVERAVLRPGEAVVARVCLQPYRQEAVEQRVELGLPAHAAPGPVILRVGSSAASHAWETERRPDAAAPRSATQLLERLQYPERGDELCVELYRAEETLAIDGRELPGLPPSAQAILQQAPSAGRLGAVHGRVLQRLRVPTSYVLSGEQSLELTVRKP